MIPNEETEYRQQMREFYARFANAEFSLEEQAQRCSEYIEKKAHQRAVYYRAVLREARKNKKYADLVYIIDQYTEKAFVGGLPLALWQSYTMAVCDLIITRAAQKWKK